MSPPLSHSYVDSVQHAMHHAAQREECSHVKCDIFTRPRFETIYDVSDVTYSRRPLLRTKHHGFRGELGSRLINVTSVILRDLKSRPYVTHGRGRTASNRRVEILRLLSLSLTHAANLGTKIVYNLTCRDSFRDVSRD